LAACFFAGRPPKARLLSDTCERFERFRAGVSNTNAVKNCWGFETIMTKAEIVQALYTRVGGFSKKESADIVDLVFEMMKETLGRGEKIKISGFGNFVLRDKRQRPGRNPQTGDPIKISERRVLTFKASQILKQALNPKNGSNGNHVAPSGSASSGVDGAARPQVSGTSGGSSGLGTSGLGVPTSVAAAPTETAKE
jgi:integration host factor subunit alpha